MHVGLETFKNTVEEFLLFSLVRGLSVLVATFCVV